VSDSYHDWRARLAEANDAAFWPIEAIDAMVIAGTAQFWCDGKSALVTRIVEYPGGAREVNILAVAGTLESVWGAVEPQIADFARSRGATKVYGIGRLGWVKSAKAHGWEYEMAMVSKDLTR
jgi:hypothetical protein